MTRALPLVLIASLAACSDQLTNVSGRSANQQSAATTTNGNPHVHLLPPLAPAAANTGVFDGALQPEVLIYAGTEAPCPDAVSSGCAPLVAAFNSTEGGAERVRVDTDAQHYIVNWKPAKGAAGAHQVLIRVGGQTIESFQVTIEKLGAVPIKFRIEQGALRFAVTPVGAAGGTVNAGGGSVTLVIPSGALTSPTQISVEQVAPRPSDARAVSGIFEFGPDGTTFSTPVTISLAYDPALLPADVSPRMLRLHTFVDGAWQLVDGSSVDTESNVVSGPTSHFSMYAVLPTGFTSISSGEMHSCGLSADGAAWCWGSNASGQLGTTATCSLTNPTTGVVTQAACATTAVEVQGNHQFRSIEAGNSHTCAVTYAGEAYCWGANQWGQLGTGTTVGSTAPVRAAPALTFAQVSVDHLQSCGVTTAGEVYCWGANNNNQLGSVVATTCMIGTTARPCSTTPVKVNIAQAQSVDVGLGHSCALTTSKAVYCWGWNIFGQIGTGAISNSEPPTLVPGGPYESVSAGAVHNCMTKAGGAGYCFGRDYMPNGALGHGTNGTRLAPTAVAGGIAFSQIDASNGNYVMTHSCGVSTANVAYCWGGNVDGQLGVQTAPQTCTSTFAFALSYDCAPAPIPVSGGLLFSYVTTSAGFVCGYTVTGEVYCWGKNTYGQLGNGTTAGSRVPVKVSTSGYLQ